MVGLAHTCDIYRMHAVGTNGREQMSASPVYSSVQSLFLPMATRTAIENHFSIGRAYDVYFADGQDVKQGDKLAYNGSTFIVRFIQPFTGLPGGVSHIRAFCEQEIA